MNEPSNPSDKPQPRRRPQQGQHGRHMMDEPDIGSGEKTPAEQETEEHIKSIPPLPHDTSRRGHARQ